MKRRDLLTLWDVLTNLERDSYPVKFSFFIVNVKLIVKKEIEALNRLRTPDLNYINYDKERVNLARKYCDKDENDQPIINNNNYQITKNLKDFNNAISILTEKYKTVIEVFDSQIRKYSQALNEEYKFDYGPFPLSVFPEVIEPNILEIFLICNLIKE